MNAQSPSSVVRRYFNAVDAEDFDTLRQVLHPEWHRSEWTKREVVQSDATKVHVATRFARLREDGSEIVAFDSLYVLTLADGVWAIQGRSSFAP